MSFPNAAPIPVSDWASDAGPVLDVVIPVYNEEADLTASVRRLHDHLSRYVPYSFRITIADNASTDATPEIAHTLAAELPRVTVLQLDQKGKGRALRAVWSQSDAAVLAYMDVDLSTDLSALLPLIAPLMSGHSDLAIGTRLHRAARVERGTKREFVSRSYNLLLRLGLTARFSDGGCGFKAIRREAAATLLPLVEDNGWFFDTELLVLADRAGLRIHEVPVDWVDDPNSKVNIVSTAKDDLRGMIRLGRSLANGAYPLRDLGAELGRHPAASPVPGVPVGLAGQLLRFGIVGAVSTVVYLALFLSLSGPLGSQTGNAVALLLTTVGNTALNRRFTFAVSGRTHLTRHQLRGLAVFGVAMAFTSGSLAVVHATHEEPSRALETALLLAANASAIVFRFLMLRRWVFAGTTSAPTESATCRAVLLPRQRTGPGGIDAAPLPLGPAKVARGSHSDDAQ